MSNFFSNISLELGTINNQGQFESFDYQKEFGSLTAKISLTKSGNEFRYYAEDVATIHHRIYFQIDDGNGNYSYFNNFNNNSNFYYTLRPEQLGSIGDGDVVEFTESYFGNPIEIGKYLGTLRSGSHNIKAEVRSVKKNIDYSQDYFDFSQGTIGNTPTGWTGNGLRRVSNGTNSAMALAGTATSVANTDDAPSSSGNFRVARINKTYGAFRDMQVEFQATYAGAGGTYQSGTTTYTNPPENSANSGFEWLFVQYKLGNGNWQSGKIITAADVTANVFTNFKLRIHQSTSNYEDIQIRFVSKTMTSGSSTHDVWIIDSVRVKTTDADAADQDSGNDGWLDTTISSNNQTALALWEWNETLTDVYWENLGAGLPAHLTNSSDNEPYFEIKNGSITQARVVLGARGESKMQNIWNGSFFIQTETARAAKFKIRIQSWNPAGIMPFGGKSTTISVDGGFYLVSNYGGSTYANGRWSQNQQLQRVEMDLSSYFTVQDFWETQTIYVILEAYGTASDGVDYLVDSYNFNSSNTIHQFNLNTASPWDFLTFKSPGTDSSLVGINDIRARTDTNTDAAYEFFVGVHDPASGTYFTEDSNGNFVSSASVVSGFGNDGYINTGTQLLKSGTRWFRPSNGSFNYYGAAGSTGTRDTGLNILLRARKGPGPATTGNPDGYDISSRSVDVVASLRRGWQFNTTHGNNGIDVGFTNDGDSNWSQESLVIYADNSSASAHWFQVYFSFLNSNGDVVANEVYTVDGTYSSTNALTNNGSLHYRDLGKVIPDATLSQRIPSIYNNFGYKINVLVVALDNLEGNISFTQTSNINISSDFGLEPWNFYDANQDGRQGLGFTISNNGTSWNKISMTVYTENSTETAHSFRAYVYKDGNAASSYNKIINVDGLPTSSGGRNYYSLGDVFSAAQMNAMFPTIFDDAGHRLKIRVYARDDNGGTISQAETGWINISSAYGIPEYSWNFDNTHSKNVFTNHFLSNTQYYVKYTPASDNSTANSINNDGYKARSFVIYNKALTGANRPYRTIISDVLSEVKEYTLRLDQTANTASELSMLQDPARDSDAFEEFEVKAYDDGNVELDAVSFIKYIPAKPTIEITNCLVTDYEGNGGIVQVSYKISCSDEGSLANKFKISLTYSGSTPISIRKEGSSANYLSEIVIVDENSVVEEDLGGGFTRYSRTGTINLDVLSFQPIQNANSTSGSATGILKATPIDDYQIKYSNREYSKNLTIKMPFEFADNLSSSFSHYSASEVEISIANIYARDASITTVSPQNYRFKYYYGNQLLESVTVSAATIQSSGFYNRDITNNYFQRTVGGDVKVVIEALNSSGEVIKSTETTASPATPIASVQMVPQLSYDILISKDERNIGVSEVKILKPDNNTLAFLDGQNVKIYFQDRITVQSGSTYVVEQDWTTQSTQTLVVGDGSFASTYETSFYKNYQFAKNATSRNVAHRIIVEVELGNTWVQGSANSSYDEIYFHEYPDSDSNVQLLQHIAGSYNSDGTQNQGKIKLDLPGDFVFNDNGFDLSMVVKETVMSSLDDTLEGNTAEVSLTHADIRNYTWSSTVNDAGRTNVLNYDCIINDEAFYLSELKITATAAANNNSDLILAYQNAGGTDKIDTTFSKTRTFISEAVMNDLTLGSQALQPINVEMPLRSDGEFALTDRTVALTFGFDVVNNYYQNVSPKIVIGLGLLHYKNNSSDNTGYISNGIVCMKPGASKLVEFYLGDVGGISNATASAYKDDLLIDLKTSPLLQKDGTLFEFPVSISYEHSLYDYNGNSFDPERELAHLIYIYVEEHIQEAAINLQAYNTSGPIVISQDGSTSASNFQLPNTWLRTTDLLNAINLGELMSSYGHLEKDDNLGFVDTTEYATFNNYSVVEDSNITNYNIELDFINNNIKKLPFYGSVEKVNIAMRSDQKIVDGETETYDLLVSSQQDYTTDVNPITDTVLHSIDRANYRVENEVRFVATPQVYVEKSFGDLDTKVIRSKPLNFSQILDSSKTVERNYYEDFVPDFNPPFQLVVDETLDISTVDAELQNVQVTFIYKASEFTDAVEYFGTSHENITITRSIIQLGVELTETAVNVYNGNIFSLNSTALSDGSGNLKFTFVDENIDLASVAGGFHPDSNFFWKYTIVPGLSYNPGGGAEQISNRDSLEESIQLVPVNLALSLPPVYDLEWEYNKEHSLTVTWKYSSATSRGESSDKDTIRDFWIENEAIYFDVYWRAHEESEREWRLVNSSRGAALVARDKIKDSKYNIDFSNTRKKVQDMSDWKKSGTLKMLKEEELTYSHVIEYDKIPTKYGITAAIIARTDHNSVYKSASQSINTHYEGENTIGIDQRGTGIGVNEGVLVDPPRNKKIKVHKTENEMKNISDKMKKRNLDFEDDLLQNISQVPISVTRRKAKIRKSDKPYDSKP